MQPVNNTKPNILIGEDMKTAALERKSSRRLFIEMSTRTAKVSRYK